MNRLTIVCGMKWNWPASFTMWNTIQSAPVWYRIQPIGLGRTQGWQAKAPAPQLPQTLAKCRNSSRRLSAGAAGIEDSRMSKRASEKAAAGKIACPTKPAELRPHYNRCFGGHSWNIQDSCIADRKSTRLNSSH